MSSTNHQYEKLISDIKNSLIIHLNKSITDMFIKLDDFLLKSYNSDISSEEQNQYFELRRKSNALKDNILDQFINIVTLSLRPEAVIKAEKNKKKDSDIDELSLVEQSELEEMVLLKSMSDSAAGFFNEPLSHLEARLEFLATQTPDIFYKKSLRPINFFQAYDDTLSDEFDPFDKQILLKFFNDHVALNLGNAYEKINTLLIDADILPQIKLHAKKSPSGTSQKASAPEHAPPQPDEATGHQAQAGAQQRMPQGGTTPNAAPGSTQAGYHHTTAGMPAEQVSKVVGEFLTGTPLMPATAGGEHSDSSANQFFPDSTGQHYGHQEVLTALSNIQLNPAFTGADETRFDSEAIKQAVLSEISKTSGGAVTKKINKLAEKTIDFIELIFDAIIDDENISDTIRTLLLRLQIPVIKASMIDQEFFIQDDHPARILLDKIAHVGVGVVDRDNDIYKHLNKIVTALVNEFDMQVESFQLALDSLNAFIEKREAEALKNEEKAQQKVLSEHARNTVLKSLRFATKGRLLPEPIHALILKRWPTMMYNHYMKHGKENDTWVNIVDTLRALIISVQPLKNANELDHLVSTREHLIEATRSYLQSSNQSEADINQIIQDLNDIHQSMIDQADFDENTALAPTDTTVEVEPVEEEEEKLQLPSNLAPGMWFQVYNGEDRAQRRCKLSVVLIEDQKLVFVNYQGEIILEKNIGDFLDELNEGKSNVIMGHSVFDHALSSVVHNLQGNI